jgi:phosphohistidine swiveling domain-containing protein
LVTCNTDPGWMAVFSKIGGLITETGGILSHGAVVSREYGIPAVTAVKNATKILKTGQRVTLDGNEGIIYLEEMRTWIQTGSTNSEATKTGTRASISTSMTAGKTSAAS